MIWFWIFVGIHIIMIVFWCIFGSKERTTDFGPGLPFNKTAHGISKHSKEMKRSLEDISNKLDLIEKILGKDNEK